MPSNEIFGPALTLGIDTSSPRSSVCLAKGRDILAAAEAEELGSAESLTRLVAEVCREATVAPRAIELIAVNLGPGSFTGLRTGLASAYGLGLGWNRPVRGVSAFASRLGRRLERPGTYRVRLRASAEEYFWTILEASAVPGGWRLRAVSPALATRIDTFDVESAEAAARLTAAPEAVDDDAQESKTEARDVALAGQFMSGEGPDFQDGGAGGGLAPLYIKAANAKTLVERGK